MAKTRQFVPSSSITKAHPGGGRSMTKGAMATLSAGVAVFGFDPEPGTPASRALHVLTVKRTLPTGDLGPKERFTEAALRAATEAGIDLGGRRGTRVAQRA